MGIRTLLTASLALLLLPACGSDDDLEAVSTTTATPTTRTGAPTALPAELQATWRLDSETVVEPVRLILRDGSYTISRGGASGSGEVAVDGDELVFSNSDLCDGVGRYTWSLDGDRLSLERLEEACSGRAPVLEGATYLRGG